MTARLVLLCGLLLASIGSGGAAYVRSEPEHLGCVREVAASYLDRRYGDPVPAERVRVGRGPRRCEFTFAAPVDLLDGRPGVVSGTMRWNGFVYEVSDRLEIR